jgi:hypothetical protein
MWQLYSYLAQDLIRERQREAAAIARARRAAAPDAGWDTGSADRSRATRSRAGAPRRTLVAVLRRVEMGAGSVARAASGTAARVEGPVEGRVEGGAA